MYSLQVYEKTPSTTLNADEAVSRGCALQCAILSPTFKVPVGTGNSLYPYLVQCPGAVRYSAPSSVLHSR